MKFRALVLMCAALVVGVEWTAAQELGIAVDPRYNGKYVDIKTLFVPVYPEVARARKVEGDVFVTVHFNGCTPDRANIAAKGDALLTGAALYIFRHSNIACGDFADSDATLTLHFGKERVVKWKRFGGLHYPDAEYKGSITSTVHVSMHFTGCTLDRSSVHTLGTPSAFAEAALKSIERSVIEGGDYRDSDAILTFRFEYIGREWSFEAGSYRDFPCAVFEDWHRKNTAGVGLYCSPNTIHP